MQDINFINFLSYILTLMNTLLQYFVYDIFKMDIIDVKCLRKIMR